MSVKPLTTVGLASAALILSSGLIGCGDATGPDREAQFVTVRMEQTSGTASASLTARQATVGGTTVSADNVPREAVDAVNVTIHEVQVLAAEEDTASGRDGGWVALNVQGKGGQATVNLMDLPSTGTGVTIAAGQLDQGTYRNVRLVIESADIVLNSAVTLGGGPNAPSLEAGTHDLFIPSAEQTGVKVPTAEFTVDTDNVAVDVLADTEASIQNINLTGRGLLMTPVLTAAAEDES